MSSAQSLSRWATATTGSMMLLMLASKAIAVYSATITVEDGDKIQNALDIVQPGDTIEIESGQYYEDVKTTVHGTADQRITIKAAGGSSNRENVVLRGEGGYRVFEINHDYYTIESFTINGENLNEEANEDNYKTAIRDKTLYVAGTEEPTLRDGGYYSAVDGLIVRDMAIENAGGECIRLRYFVTNAEIYENDLTSCGLYDYEFKDGGENGEGIYIGTSNKQWDDGKNPTDDPDVCRGNVVRDNTIKTHGNEGVEVKEGGVDNIIENNKIYMQMDPDSGGISSRGDGTIIRYNYIEEAAGAGVRLGGAEVDGYQYGVNNEVYGNTMVECLSYGVKIMVSSQGKLCGNDIELPESADDDDYAYTGGTYGSEYDAREDCDSTPTPSPIPSVPTPSTPAPGTPTSSTPAPSSSLPLTPTPVTPSPLTSAPRTPSPTNDSEPGIKYLGCFADASDSRTMSFGYKDVDGMSNEDCIHYCRSKGKAFAGTMRGFSCRCANSNTEIDKNGESTSCTTPCTGDDSAKCGGWWAVSTWQI